MSGNPCIPLFPNRPTCHNYNLSETRFSKFPLSCDGCTTNCQQNPILFCYPLTVSLEMPIEFFTKWRILFCTPSGERHLFRISCYSRKAFSHSSCTWQGFYCWGLCIFYWFGWSLPTARFEWVVAELDFLSHHICLQPDIIHLCCQVSSFNTSARGSSGNQMRTSKSPHCSKNDYIRWKNCQARDFTINGSVCFYTITGFHTACCGICIFWSQVCAG